MNRQMIDWDELDAIEQMHRGWRVNYPELSQVYVPGEGDNSEAFIIGEAPGAQEELRCRPFVGPAGVAQRDLMSLAGLYATDWENTNEKTYGVANCWLTNVVKFRPPRNRTPSPEMIMSVRSILRREYYAVGRPRLVIPVGAVALQAVLGRRVSILAVSGKPQRHMSSRGMPMWIYPMIHPSYAVRNPQLRPLLVKDWEALSRWRK